jgi:hypothetical protein
MGHRTCVLLGVFACFLGLNINLWSQSIPAVNGIRVTWILVRGSFTRYRFRTFRRRTSRHPLVSEASSSSTSP